MVDEVRPPTALVISQAYVPHPASVGSTWPMQQLIWSDASRLQQEIATKLEQPDSKLSDWHGDALVWKFNRTDSTGPFETTPELAAVIDEKYNRLASWLLVSLAWRLPL